MTEEYVRLTSEHISYTQKALLEGQLSSLMSMKHLHAYKTLRNEELLSKIKLKMLIEQTKQEIDILIKSIPSPSYKEDDELEVINIAPKNENERKNASIEDELDAIKAKLAKLQ